MHEISSFFTHFIILSAYIIDITVTSRALKDLVLELCDICTNDRVRFNMLKYVGDAHIQVVVANYLKMDKLNWPLMELRSLEYVKNNGKLLEVFNQYVSPIVIASCAPSSTPLEWQRWNNHTKCDFVEALVALSEEKDGYASSFIYSRMVLTHNK
jgi:hypothetical protein